ncbi:TetR/AcrR family transcriptional regulator, partial [Aquimarina sp. 433]
MDGNDTVFGSGGSARSPVQQRSRERRAKILDAARELISERGSDRLRMNELAQAAAVSMGSLYQYFPEKSAVIYALAEAFN